MKDTKLEKIDLFGEPASTGSYTNAMLKRNKDAIASLRPIDDIMFEKLMENPKVCEEILRIILDDDTLSVLEVVQQASIKNLRGRSVRLDALCTLGNGSKCNVEVQRADNDDHQRRVRYNASVVTSNIVSPGERFEDVPDLIMVYISEFDIFGQGRVIYHVERFIQEDMWCVNNGLHEIYVTAKQTDKSLLGDLMRSFLESDLQAYNKKFPQLSTEFKNLKGDERTVSYMNKILEERDKERDKKRDKERDKEYNLVKARECIASGMDKQKVLEIFGLTESDL